jgi:hypothetical protein
MTVWLRRQESVHKFGSYLQWAVPGYLAPITSADSSDDEDEDLEDAPGQDLPEDSDDKGELEEVATSKESSKPTYLVAKKPGFPSLTAQVITTDFKAPDFLDNLADFLHSKSIIPHLVPTNSSTFPVYKKLSLTLPVIAEVGSGDTRDTIRAVKGQPLRMTPKGVRAEKAGQFDTVLARLRPKQADECATGGNFSLLSQRAYTEINFQDFVSHVFASSSVFPLISGNSQNQSPTLTGLSPSAAGGWARNASSVSFLTKSPAEVIYYRHFRHHTFLPFASSLRPHSPRWTPENVLDLCESFYLNPYIRHHDFYLFRYLIAIDAARKAAAERRVRMKTLGRAGR